MTSTFNKTIVPNLLSGIQIIDSSLTRPTIFGGDASGTTLTNVTIQNSFIIGGSVSGTDITTAIGGGDSGSSYQRTFLNEISGVVIPSSGDYVIATKNAVIIFPAICNEQQVTIIDTSTTLNFQSSNVLQFPGSNLHAFNSTTRTNFQGRQETFYGCNNIWYITAQFYAGNT